MQTTGIPDNLLINPKTKMDICWDLVSHIV